MTALTTAGKFGVVAMRAAPLGEGVLMSINYAGSFSAMQAMGFTLATKQPTMTAATLARAWQDNASGSVDALVEQTASIARSQFAAALGNVSAVIPTAILFHYGWARLAGPARTADSRCLQRAAALADAICIPASDVPDSACVADTNLGTVGTRSTNGHGPASHASREMRTSTVRSGVREATRQRSIRAALAVTLGATLAACGSEPAGADDGRDDGGAGDTSGDTTPVDTGDDSTDIPDVTNDLAPPPDTTTQPDAIPPDPPDVVAPDVPLVDVGEPDTAEPDVIEPDVTEPDVAPPDVVDPDTSEPDVALPDVDEDADVDEPVDCKAETDGQCPVGCTVDNDRDCCESRTDFPEGWCFFDPSFGCGCAVEGPFAPPSLPFR